MSKEGAIMLFNKEHYDLMAAFEKEFRGHRLDKESKDLWPKGIIYQNGETNNMFLAYRRGCSYGRAVCVNWPDQQ